MPEQGQTQGVGFSLNNFVATTTPLVLGEDAIGMYHPVIPATNTATPATLDSGVLGLGTPGRLSGVTNGETSIESDTCQQCKVV